MLKTGMKFAWFVQNYTSQHIMANKTLHLCFAYLISLNTMPIPRQYKKMTGHTQYSYVRRPTMRSFAANIGELRTSLLHVFLGGWKAKDCNSCTKASTFTPRSWSWSSMGLHRSSVLTIHTSKLLSPIVQIVPWKQTAFRNFHKHRKTVELIMLKTHVFYWQSI